MTDIIQQLEKERIKLLKYFYWQIFWGVVFVILVFISSFLIGAKSERFWLYIVMPLIVTGAFWVYFQTTKKSTEQKLNERILKTLINSYLPNWDYLPIYKIPRQIFVEAKFVDSFLTVESRNALIGTFDDFKTTICYIKADKDEAETTSIAFAGKFAFTQIDKPIYKFAIYPKNADIQQIKKQLNLQEINTKISSQFKVLAPDLHTAQFINQNLGLEILKFANLQKIEDKLYISTLNNSLNIGIFDYKDIINFKLNRPITQQVLNQEFNNLKQLINFIHTLIQLLINQKNTSNDNTN